MQSCLKFLSFLFLISLLYPNVASSQERQDTIVVCAIGDSHFTSGSALIRELRRQLGPGYEVIAAGRRGWSTRLWLRHLDEFVEACHESDIVLVSLGGNDRTIGFSEEEIENNLDLLLSSFSELIEFVYHIERPSDYYGRDRGHGRFFEDDHIHLNASGARDYAEYLIDRFIR